MTPEQAIQLLTTLGDIRDLLVIVGRLVCLAVGVGLFAAIQGSFRI